MLIDQTDDNWLLSNAEDLIPSSPSSSLIINNDTEDLKSLLKDQSINKNETRSLSTSLDRTFNDVSKQALISSQTSSRSSSLTNNNNNSQMLEYLDENVFFDEDECLKLKFRRKFLKRYLPKQINTQPVENVDRNNAETDEIFEDEFDNPKMIDELIEELDSHIMKKSTNSSFNSSVQSIHSIKYNSSNSPFMNTCSCKIKCYCLCHQLNSSKTNSNSLSSSITSQHSKIYPTANSSNNNLVKSIGKISLKSKCKSLDSYDSLEWDISLDHKKLNNELLIIDDLNESKNIDNESKNIINELYLAFGFGFLI
jgi:hypothetical protein